MRKSICPSSFTQRSTADPREATLRTSTPPTPSTTLPSRAVAMLFAICSVFSEFLPTMQALAPRCTSARTCAEQMVPLPPVQKTTLSLKMPSFHTLERYCVLGIDMIDNAWRSCTSSEDGMFVTLYVIMGTTDLVPEARDPRPVQSSNPTSMCHLPMWTNSQEYQYKPYLRSCIIWWIQSLEHLHVTDTVACPDRPHIHLAVR